MAVLDLYLLSLSVILGPHRAMAQLVARLVWDQEVEGSSPSGPTKKTGVCLFFCRIRADQLLGLRRGSVLGYLSLTKGLFFAIL